MCMAPLETIRWSSIRALHALCLGMDRHLELSASWDLGCLVHAWRRLDLALSWPLDLVQPIRDSLLHRDPK